MMHLKTPACPSGQWVLSWTVMLLALLLPCMAMQVAAQSPSGPLAITHNGSYPLSRYFTFLEDTTAKLTIDDVLRTDMQARFVPVASSGSSVNFGSTDSAMWLRLQLVTENNTPMQWLLEVANPPLDHLDIYVSSPGGGYDHQAGGDLLPFGDRDIPHRNHVKAIDLQPGAVTTLYLRIASQGTVSAPTTLWQPAALWRHDQQTYSIFSLYFGLLIGLLLYNLLLYFSVRDHAYLIYVVFVAFIGLSQAANSGIGGQFLWPNAVWWNNNSINATNALSGTFGMLFARSFLASRSKMPRLDRWMRAQTGLWIVSFLLVFVLPYKPEAQLVTALVLVGVVTVVVAAVLSIRRRHPGAPYFGLAWSALLLGVVTLAMHNNGLLPSNAFTANAVLIGSSLEMVLLSFALADRINTARRDKEAAQSQMIAEQATVHALEQSQAHYQAVIEHLGEGMVVLQDERIVFVNTRATEILETSKERIFAEGVGHRLQAGDRAALAERIRRRLAGLKVSERCQVRLERNGESDKWLECGETLVPWDGGQGLLIFFLDVTERHQAEQDIRTTLHRQRELNDLRSRFVAMTSHEFRTPLASILSSQDLLKHYSERLPAAEKTELLGIIESGVHRMTGMLDRVLLLGKAEAHMLEFKPHPLDLKKLCGDLVHEAARQQPNNNCTVTLDFSTSAHSGVFDEKLMRHIFGNLLSNAIKYSPHGGEVRFVVTVEGEATLFEITDQGIGIPPDEIGHLFESFHRASNVGAIQGTGLGLAIVKNAVELHGGTIQVRSDVGRGTSFSVCLNGDPVNRTIPAAGPDPRY